MKIIQTGTFPLDISCVKGGVEASIYGLANEQAKTNQVYAIDMPRQALQTDARETINGIEVFRYVNKQQSNNGAIRRINTIIRQIKLIKPDICHIHGTNPFSFVLLCLLKFNNIKTIVTVHGLSHIEKQNQWKNKKTLFAFVKYIYHSVVEFLILSLSKKVIVDTGYVENEIKKYRKQWKIWRMPDCRVIPQGVDERYFQLQNDKVENNCLLSVGAINKRKGHLYLIETMKLVHDKIPEIKLYIAGIKSDESYYFKIREKIKKLQLETVVFLQTDVSFNELLNYYSKSALFVLHSEEESQGIVFCEAMAAGKPVVATNVGGIPWVVEHGVNGYLSDYADVNAFANNITNLLNDKTGKNQMSAINKREACKYDWKIISMEILDLYHQ